MRRIRIACLCIPLLGVLFAGCGGPEIPREDLGQVDLGQNAVPFRDREVRLTELPPPKSPIEKMMGR